MPRYHFHLHDADGSYHDLEGHELIDDAAARDEAIRCARDIICDEAKTGIIDLRSRLQVDDPDGRTVLTLGFDEAVRIVRA